MTADSAEMRCILQSSRYWIQCNFTLSPHHHSRVSTILSSSTSRLTKCYRGKARLFPGREWLQTLILGSPAPICMHFRGPIRLLDEHNMRHPHSVGSFLREMLDMSM